MTQNIDNKNPIFAQIFKDFNSLPPVFQKHYKNHAYCDEANICQGKMRVWLAPITKLAAPFLAFSDTLISKSGENIDVQVIFRSCPIDDSFTYDRKFNFPDGKSQDFTSRMQPIGENNVIEWTKSGLGWGAKFDFIDGKVMLSHNGYFVRIFGKIVRLPLEILFGRATAYEIAKSDNEFSMYMEIRHFLLGKIYEYSGDFRMID